MEKQRDKERERRKRMEKKASMSHWWGQRKGVFLTINLSLKLHLL